MAFKCDYTMEKLKDLGMFELSEILEQNSIPYDNLETDEEIRELVMKKLSQNTFYLIWLLDCENLRFFVQICQAFMSSRMCLDGVSSDSVCKHPNSGQNIQTVTIVTYLISFNHGADLMNSIISNDLMKKTELCKIYKELQIFFESKKIDDELIVELNTAFQNFKDTLKKNPIELTKDECPLVVTGETSAGKSSILNLLLGTEILPNSLLCSTSTICRLRHCNEKRVEVTEVGNDIPIKLNVDQLTDGKSLKSILQNYVSVEKNRADNPYKYVDIYWPVPMLKEHVIVVDTPGIGEDPKMTKRLLEYLPNAVGFIYVINSANAGGVQSDRLLKIFEYLKTQEKIGKSTFDHRCAIFICNKWDQVSKIEEDKVWEDTHDKLKASWPNFDENTQLFKMSASEVSRRLSSGLGITDKYDKFLQAIEQIIPSSLEAKVYRHVILKCVENLIKCHHADIDKLAEIYVSTILEFNSECHHANIDKLAEIYVSTILEFNSECHHADIDKLAEIFVSTILKFNSECHHADIDKLAENLCFSNPRVQFRMSPCSKG
ncbi:hypothetical protein KUTeg_008158 [Tegillarca granosa]|uniref:Dynamin N-terminal domain-containing protein n=1 Tax=Tegillarca granosa TaxID=220873 RepID=A0ABQ9F8C6_TEGGR|nr:hypothetical protein KUTeg_008158 [Tegillarca granosa]